MDRMYGYVDGKIGGVFARYGRLVARHAWKVVIVSCIVNVGLAFGMLKLEQNIKAEDNYLPFRTDARRDRDRMAEMFVDRSSSNYNTLLTYSIGAFAGVFLKSKSGNLLTWEAMQDVQRLATYIQVVWQRVYKPRTCILLTFELAKETNATAGNDTITLMDVCAKVPGDQCRMRGELFLSAEFLAAMNATTITYPAFVTSRGPVLYAPDVSGFTMDADGRYMTSLEYLSMRFILRYDNDTEDALSSDWVHALQTRMETFNSEYFEVAFGHYESVDEEIDQAVSGDISLFAVTIGLMITYAAFATMTARWDNVGQRIYLGFAGVLAAGLAIAASFGLGGLVGLEFVSIIGVVPFLVIGIGIDDFFILLSGLAGAQGLTTVEDKMAATLRTSGVGITITSLTDLLAFMAGASSSFLAVRNFCIYTGMAVIFCYLNNITLVAASCAINERRVHDSRHYATCMRVKSKADYRSEGKSAGYVFCCAGTAPTSRKQVESYLDKLPRLLLPKIVLKLPLKIITCLIFAGYLAASIYGCVNLEQGLLFKQLISTDSYFYNYAMWRDGVFSMNHPISIVLDKPYTYHSNATKSRIDDTIALFQADEYFNNAYKVSWLDTYKATGYYRDSNESSFIAGLKEFYNNPLFRRFENDVTIDDATDTITASRVYVLAINLQLSQVRGKMMLRARELADDAPLSCVAYHPNFVMYEQYVAILGQTVQTVGIALAAVFVITCIFMPHPLLILYVTAVVAMIMAGVFGFLVYLDLSLSSITMIYVIMCIGFSVDFAVHICHGFMSSSGSSRNERVHRGIDKTGAPLFHGAVSSFLGVIILFAAKSYIFVSFSKIMALMFVFGLAHSLFLLPVVLSWIRPSHWDSAKGDDKETGTDKGVSNLGMDMNDLGAVSDGPNSKQRGSNDRSLNYQVAQGD